MAEQDHKLKSVSDNPKGFIAFRIDENGKPVVVDKTGDNETERLALMKLAEIVFRRWEDEAARRVLGSAC